LATEGKTPLREAAGSPGRTQKTANRSKVARRRVILGAGAAVVLLVGLIAILTRGGNGIIPGFNTAPPPPGFNFNLTNASFEATVAGGNKQAQATTAKQVGATIRNSLDEVFTTAYLDQSSWGDTGSIEDSFTDDAKGHLKDDIDVLTLGTDAGDTYTFVQPEKSQLKAIVLTAKDGTALRAVGSVHFVAVATHKDGTYSKITVTGAYFFVKGNDGWKIEGYRLNKAEKPTKAPASASPSGASS
jgi:hypothetical protein